MKTFVRLAHDLDYLQDRLSDMVANKRRELDFRGKMFAQRALTLARQAKSATRRTTGKDVAVGEPEAALSAANSSRGAAMAGAGGKPSLRHQSTIKVKLQAKHDAEDEQMRDMADGLIRKGNVLADAVRATAR